MYTYIYIYINIYIYIYIIWRGADGAKSPHHSPNLEATTCAITHPELEATRHGTDRCRTTAASAGDAHSDVRICREQPDRDAARGNRVSRNLSYGQLSKCQCAKTNKTTI